MQVIPLPLKVMGVFSKNDLKPNSSTLRSFSTGPHKAPSSSYLIGRRRFSSTFCRRSSETKTLAQKISMALPPGATMAVTGSQLSTAHQACKAAFCGRFRIPPPELSRRVGLCIQLTCSWVRPSMADGGRVKLEAGGVRKATLSVALLAVILLLSFRGIQPPAPRQGDAPETQFSAARAFNALKRLVGDDLPHPVGSPADAMVRDRVIGELRKLGYEPEVQTAFACGAFGACATVNNIAARLEAANPAPASANDASVLLTAHYDSVPAGPGVSDDGVGVAGVIEVARALKSMPPPKHPIIILVDDGEEAGLLGARAFADSHPWARSVRAAVNLDARGTSGPSLMFETGSANQWAIRLFASRAVHPATSSIGYTVYKRLPNDTDFSVFKAAGYQGLNFAFIDDVAHYHTPLDNIANAN